MIVVFGKKNCKLCEAAKEKLNIMGYDFSFVDLEDPTDFRNKGGILDAMVEYQLNETLPWIRIEESLFSYPEAMKILKKGYVCGGG